MINHCGNFWQHFRFFTRKGFLFKKRLDFVSPLNAIAMLIVIPTENVINITAKCNNFGSVGDVDKKKSRNKGTGKTNN